MLEHTTITLTLKDVQRLEPCRDGLNFARPFLPATISTDPEENIDLANALVEAQVDVLWILRRVGVREQEYIFCCDMAGSGLCDLRRPLEQGYLVAQFLAILADRLAIGRSR